MEMPVLSKEIENEFALNSIMLNMALMPAMAEATRNGGTPPDDLRKEITKKMAQIVGRSPMIMAELIRRQDRITELEAQVAAMLLSDQEK